MQPGTFRSLPGLYPLDASPSSTTTPSCDNQKMSPDISRCPPGAKLSPAENHCYRAEYLIPSPGDFPGGPVVKTLHFYCRGLIPGWEAKISHVTSGMAKDKKQAQMPGSILSLLLSSHTPQPPCEFPSIVVIRAQCCTVYPFVQTRRPALFLSLPMVPSHPSPHLLPHCLQVTQGLTISLLQYYAAAAAAKSRQLCPTLCDPIGGSPLGSTVPGILQARTLEWVAISFSNACK